ncbi:MAG TPA: hypothetical protein VGM87_06270 [Roseomonas sp.]
MISGAVMAGLAAAAGAARAGAGFGAGTASTVTAGTGALCAGVLGAWGAASCAAGEGGRGAATLVAATGAGAALAAGAGFAAGALVTGLVAAGLAFGASFTAAFGLVAGALAAGLAALVAAFTGLAAALGFAVAFGLVAAAFAGLGFAGEDFLAWVTDLALACAAFLRRSASVAAGAFFAAVGLLTDLLPVLARLAVFIAKPLLPLPLWPARVSPGSGKRPTAQCCGMRAPPREAARTWVPIPGPGPVQRGLERGSPSPYL